MPRRVKGVVAAASLLVLVPVLASHLVPFGFACLHHAIYMDDGRFLLADTSACKAVRAGFFLHRLPADTEVPDEQWEVIRPYVRGLFFVTPLSDDAVPATWLQVGGSPRVQINPCRVILDQQLAHVAVVLVLFTGACFWRDRYDGSALRANSLVDFSRSVRRGETPI